MSSMTRAEVLARFHDLRTSARECFRAMAGRPYREPSHLWASLYCDVPRAYPLDGAVARILHAARGGATRAELEKPGLFLMDVAASCAPCEMPELPEALLAEQAVQGRTDLVQMRAMRMPTPESRQQLIDLCDEHIAALRVVRERAAYDTHVERRDRRAAVQRLAAGGR
jgi:hypothetical protein